MSQAQHKRFAGLFQCRREGATDARSTDVLVNNASVSYFEPVKDFSDDEARTQMG